MHHLTVVGCGPGDPALLTRAAEAAIAEAVCIVGSRRLIDRFAADRGQLCPARSEEAIALLDTLLHEQDVCLLVSGDVGCFSLAAAMRAHFPAEQLRCIPGISSVQLAAERLGISWAGARVLSVHGRDCRWAAEDLGREQIIIALLGGSASTDWLQRTSAALRESHDCWLCSQLGLADECVQPYTGGDPQSGTLHIAVFIAREQDQ